MSGDLNALFERLFTRYYQKVYSFFIRKGFPAPEAADLTQATFTRVYENMGTYRGGSETVELAFVMRVADSVWKNELRHRQALKRGKPPETLDDPENPVAEGAEAPLFGPPAASPEEVAAWNERVAALRRRIRALPPRMRRILMLRIQGLSYQELAVAMSSSVDAVKKLLHEARKRLRETPEPEAPDPSDEP